MKFVGENIRMTPMQLSDADREELQSEAISICQALIRIPSVNYGDGKGDESAVAKKVVELLKKRESMQKFMNPLRDVAMLLLS